MLKGNSPPEVARGREGSHGFAWGRMGSQGVARGREGSQWGHTRSQRVSGGRKSAPKTFKSAPNRAKSFPRESGTRPDLLKSAPKPCKIDAFFRQSRGCPDGVERRRAS